MNSLSWMIYAADTIPRIAATLYAFGVISIISFVALNIGCAIARGDHNMFAKPADKRPHRIEKFWLVAVGAGLILLSSPIPSRDALYMIAASEVGGKVASTPDAQEMLSDLKVIVGQQIKKLKEKAP